VARRAVPLHLQSFLFHHMFKSSSVKLAAELTAIGLSQSLILFAPYAYFCSYILRSLRQTLAAGTCSFHS